MIASGITKTILMIKEPQRDGTFRYRRIPWDLMNGELVHGLAPAPIHGSEFDDKAVVTVGTDKIDFVTDMLYFDEDMKNDEINEILYFGSENEFVDKFDHTTGYYKTASGQTDEFGYPRT